MAPSDKHLYCDCKDHKILLYNGLKNYNFWKKNMEVIFRKRSLLWLLEARNTRSVPTTEYKKKNEECIRLIVCHITIHIIGFIINEKMAYDMWHFLRVFKNKLDPLLEDVAIDILDYEGLEETSEDVEDDICPYVDEDSEDYEDDSLPPFFDSDNSD